MASLLQRDSTPSCLACTFFLIEQWFLKSQLFCTHTVTWPTLVFKLSGSVYSALQTQEPTTRRGCESLSCIRWMKWQQPINWRNVVKISVWNVQHISIAPVQVAPAGRHHFHVFWSLEQLDVETRLIEKQDLQNSYGIKAMLHTLTDWIKEANQQQLILVRNKTDCISCCTAIVATGDAKFECETTDWEAAKWLWRSKGRSIM